MYILNCVMSQFLFNVTEKMLQLMLKLKLFKLLFNPKYFYK